MQGSSTLSLGLDVTSEERDGGVDVKMNTGDVIVLPAGVSHCSKVFSPEYRYLAAYPKEGEKWKLVLRVQVDRVAPEQYNIAGDLKTAQAVPIPSGDPIYGHGKGTLLDLWVA